jgi:hypothetical protein
LAKNSPCRRIGTVCSGSQIRYAGKSSDVTLEM